MVRFRCYWRPKSDHSIEEWEDGAAFSEARQVAAIADGASSSFDAARWARELTRSFITNPPRTVDAEAFEAWTVAVAAGFEGEPAGGAGGVEAARAVDATPDTPSAVVPGVPVVDEAGPPYRVAPDDPDHGAGGGLRHGTPVAEPVLAVGQWGPARSLPRVAGPVAHDGPGEVVAPGGQRPDEDPADATDPAAATDEAEAAGAADATGPPGEPAPWYVQEAAVRGSFATFLGLQFTESPDSRRWRVMAVGDACCFHVRGGSLVAAFPVEDPDGFGSAPDLLTSQPFRGSHGGHRLQVLTGPLETGDTFYLATDAVSEWLLGRSRVDPSLWESLDALDHAGFEALVDGARRSGEMADDDATLMRAVVGPAAGAHDVL